MPSRSAEVTVSVEEEVPSPSDGPPRRVRVSATLRPEEGKAVGSQDVAEASKALGEHLRAASEALVAETPGSSVPRPDRSLPELLESYHPKSRDLIDALLWEGQLTPTEHETLRATLPSSGAKGPKASPPKALSVPAPVPLAASAHVPAGPSRPLVRSVETMIHELDLKDMRDVNRARGHRSISYDEWASLKAHFERRV